jgi:hypothetical protein
VKLPLRALMGQFGFEVPAASVAGSGKSFACPFCGNKSASFKEKNGRELFKCFHAGCSSGTQQTPGAWDSTGFIVWHEKLSGTEARKDGWMRHMKMAGLWEEKQQVTSFPRANGRKLAPPAPPKDIDLHPEASEEEQAAANLAAISPARPEVPLSELWGYSNSIRSLSRGRASYSMTPSHFERVPDALAAKVVSTAA